MVVWQVDLKMGRVGDPRGLGRPKKFCMNAFSRQLCMTRVGRKRRGLNIIQEPRPPPPGIWSAIYRCQ